MTPLLEGQPRRRWWRGAGAGAAAAALVAALLLVGCQSGGEGGGGGPTDPGGQATLTLSAADEAISVNGATTLTARALTASGAPVAEGTRIDLTTTLGTLLAASVTTDAAGRATTQLLGGGVAGQATVTATLPGSGLRAEARVDVGLGVILGLTAAPAAIGAQGSATVTVTAVQDGDGPVAAGTEIRLTTSLGVLDDARPRTDASGVASTRLRAAGFSGTATVTATADGARLPASAEVVMGDGLTLALTASPPAIGTAGASTVTARVRRLDGSIPSPGVEVSLTTTLGRLDDSRPESDSFGNAVTVLRGDGRAGLATVTATAAGALAAVSAQVTIGGDVRLTLRASPASLSTGGSATVTATVSHSDGSPVAAGTEVVLATTLGALDQDRLTTDGLGLATTTLRAGATPGTAHLTAMVPGTAAVAALDVPITAP